MLPAFRIEQIGLGLEETGFGERQRYFPAIGSFLHRHVAPGLASRRRATGMRENDFAAHFGGAAKVGAEQGAPAFVRGFRTERETDSVADKAQKAFAGRGRHDGNGWFHLKISTMKRARIKSKRRFRRLMTVTLVCFDYGNHIPWQSFLETMSVTLNPDEEAQLKQTVEMFEVIVQSQPNDCQSLEILKEAYTKLGREQDVINISKRIAEAYLQSGQLSSAILEYETVLQRRPHDTDVQSALKQIEDRANSAAAQQTVGVEPAALGCGSGHNQAQKNRALAPGRLMTVARRCVKFLWRIASSAPGILICAGTRRICCSRRRT